MLVVKRQVWDACRVEVEIRINCLPHGMDKWHGLTLFPIIKSTEYMDYTPLSPSSSPLLETLSPAWHSATLLGQNASAACLHCRLHRPRFVFSLPSFSSPPPTTISILSDGMQGPQVRSCARRFVCAAMISLSGLSCACLPQQGGAILPCPASLRVCGASSLRPVWSPRKLSPTFSRRPLRHPRPPPAPNLSLAPSAPLRQLRHPCLHP